MDISQHSLGEVLEFCKVEGYQCVDNRYANEKFVVVTIPDGETFPDAQYYRDYGYCIVGYHNIDEAMSQVGCVFCGGLYTAIALFKNGKNITKKSIINMCHDVPNGNELIPQDESDSSDN